MITSTGAGDLRKIMQVSKFEGTRRKGGGGRRSTDVDGFILKFGNDMAGPPKKRTHMIPGQEA